MGLKGYLHNRARLFNLDSEFSCPEWCDRFGCRDERLHVSVSIIDVASASLLTGQMAPHLFRSHYKIGAYPMEDSPWIQRFALELRKPCPFLVGKECSIYEGRPITCALFPEASFLCAPRKGGLNREKFGHYPCFQEPPMTSERRRSHLMELMEMARREAFLTEFYFFGFSPFFVDLRNTVMDVMQVSHDMDGEGEYEVPHEAFEEILVRRLGRGGCLSEIDSKVERLNSPGALEGLYGIKKWTDSVAASHEDFPYCYEFDEGHQLRLVKRLT